MSKGEILYVKGINTSDSEEEETELENDIWDDTKLNQAYDKAVSIANAEIAKRIAMGTNTNGSNSQSDSSKMKKNKSFNGGNSKASKKESKTIWKAGMPCRAVFEEDGMEYEAFLLRIINDKECVVRFLGYNNSEIVSLSTLKQSLGNKERAQQIQDALAEGEGGESGHRSSDYRMDYDSPSTDRSSHRKKKSSKNNRNSVKNADMPFEMPFPMPHNMPQFRNFNLGSMDFPFPPPVAVLQSDKPDSEDQAISSMLLSWYMSGYYTGLYQGMKRSRTSKKNSN